MRGVEGNFKNIGVCPKCGQLDRIRKSGKCLQCAHRDQVAMNRMKKFRKNVSTESSTQ